MEISLMAFNIDPEEVIDLVKGNMIEVQDDAQIALDKLKGDKTEKVKPPIFEDPEDSDDKEPATSKKSTPPKEAPTPTTVATTEEEEEAK
jgi:hypothetical protein